MRMLVTILTLAAFLIPTLADAKSRTCSTRKMGSTYRTVCN